MSEDLRSSGGNVGDGEGRNEFKVALMVFGAWEERATLGKSKGKVERAQGKSKFTFEITTLWCWTGIQVAM
jgi:hypothetical protein